MMAAQEQGSEAAATERWSLVQRVAAGAPLQRSARLRMLLLHVGQQSLFGGGAGLREMEIGHEVFGRPAQYDTSQDNIVRVNFSELRKRIQQYFSAEGQHEAVQFDIPRGSYELRFYDRPRDAFDEVSAQSPTESLPASGEELVEPEPTALHDGNDGVKRWVFTCFVLAAMVVCAVAAAIWSWKRARAAEDKLAIWSSGPALRRFWQPFFDGPEPVDIVLADSSLALAQDLTGQDLSLSDYIAYNYQPLYEAESARHLTSGTAKLLLARNTGSAGDFRVAAMIQALGPRPLSRMFFSRGYTTAAVRDHNSVLLGSRRSNPWVELLEDRLCYRFSSSPDRRETYITVMHPRAGEPAQYAAISDPSAKVSYGVIAVLPSPGGRAHSLLIAGTDSQATLAAGELLTNEEKLEEISRRIGGKAMDHIQILIRAEAMRDTPINAQILSVCTDF